MADAVEVNVRFYIKHRLYGGIQIDAHLSRAQMAELHRNLQDLLQEVGTVLYDGRGEYRRY